MLKKINRAFLLSIIFMLIFVLGVPRTDALVQGWSPEREDASSLSDNGDNYSSIPPSNDNEKLMEEEKSDEYIDFGSEQVFPFIPGLDSY